MKMDDDIKKGILESLFIVYKYCPDAFEMELAEQCTEDCVSCWIKTLCKEEEIKDDFANR